MVHADVLLIHFAYLFLVSQHNDDNGEDGRDGSNDNFSWNCGHEGHLFFLISTL